MHAETLATIRADHTAWRNGQGGKRANLRKADLRGADLSYATMSGADLTGANLDDALLSDANLHAASGVLAIDSIGSRGDSLYVIAHPRTRMYKAGCFWGTEKAFLAAVDERHGTNEHGQAYRLAVELARLLLPLAGDEPNAP
jgi:hypothetical protein